MTKLESLDPSSDTPGTPGAESEDRLESWKEIATYLGRTVRTVQRWEKTAGLPVRRLRHDAGASVYALQSELDAWHLHRSDELDGDADPSEDEDASGAVDSEEPGASEPGPREASRSHPSEAKPPDTSSTEPAAAAEGSPAPTARVEPGARPPAPRRRLGLLAALAVVAAVAALSTWLLSRPSEPPPSPVVVSLLTTSPGVERVPALSPDGRQVAYVWDGDGDSVDLYVRLVGAGGSLQLTDDEAVEESPAWSPDGLSIAFLRHAGPGRRELRVVPALGGAERLIGVFDVPLELDTARSIQAAISWAPGGDWIAMTVAGEPVGRQGIVAVDVRSGDSRPLTRPPVEFEDLSPSFSPSGDRLAFTRSGGSLIGELYVLELQQGADGPEPGDLRRIPGAGDWNAEPVWTPNGRQLIFSSGRWPRSALWRVAADGSSPPRPISDVGQGGSEPSVAPLPGGPSSGEGAWRLVYTLIDLDNDIWRTEFPTSEEPDGREQRLISSTQRERFPAFSPDGARIAFLSDRSGHREVWVTDAQGRAPQQWTAWESSYVWSVAWSPDGRQLAYTVELDGVLRAHVQDGPLGSARALSDDGASEQDLTWARDGRSLFVSSRDRGDGPGIWRVDASGSNPPELVVPIWGRPLGEDPSGAALFVSVGEGNAIELVRVSLDGENGVETVALEGGNPDSFTLGPDGVYFVAEGEAGHELRRLRFDDGSEERVTGLDQPENGIAIAPDGRSVLWSRIGLLRSDLMVADGLR